MLIPGAFSPLREGRSFSGTYNLFCIAFPFLGSQVFTALKLNSDKLLAPWLCRQCQYRKPAQTRLQKPSKAVSNLAYIHSLIFLGLVPYKMAMYVLASIFCESQLYVLGSASADWEACLSKNEITAAYKLFACVVSPTQPVSLPSFQSEMRVNHVAASGGFGEALGKSIVKWAFSAHVYWVSLDFIFQVDSWFWKSNRFS